MKFLLSIKDFFANRAVWHSVYRPYGTKLVGVREKPLLSAEEPGPEARSARDLIISSVSHSVCLCRASSATRRGGRAAGKVQGRGSGGSGGSWEFVMVISN